MDKLYKDDQPAYIQSLASPLREYYPTEKMKTDEMFQTLVKVTYNT